MSHYNHGNLPLAFVFSVPGAVESSTHRPVSGVTGENLSIALCHLHLWRPEVFGSTDRYAYRITNAFNNPIAKSLGNKSTEASKRDVLSLENIDRVIQETEGCNIVVLCGLRAQLLSSHLSKAGAVTFNAWHTSSQALNSKYNCSSIKELADADLRRKNRALLWANDLASLLSTTINEE
jgi:hypothetical protein